MELEQSEFWIDVEGRFLRARRLKSPAVKHGFRPVMVLLHEALGCIDMWKDVPQQLARRTGCEVLVYERFGHGQSGSLPQAAQGRDYLDYEAWTVLPAVLTACRLERPLLVGHSDGATLALMYAARFPDQLAGVVSEAGHLFVEAMTLAGIRAVRRTSGPQRLMERLARYHADPEPIFRRWTQVWLSEDFAAWTIEPLMPNVTCPVLAIQGEDDEYGSFRQVAALLNGVGASAGALMLPDCRHIPHFQAPPRYLDAVASFAADIRPSQRG